MLLTLYIICRKYGIKLTKLKKINLFIITSSYPIDNFQTDGNFIEDFCRNINKTGIFNIYVLAPHKHLSKRHEIRRSVNITRFPYFYPYRLQDLAYDEGLPYKIHNSFLHKLQLPFFILSELFFSIKIIKRERIDIINSQWMIPQGLIGAICKSILKIPHIVTMHSSEITFLKNIFFGKTLIRFILTNSDVIISVSKHRANELLDFINFKDHHLPVKIRIVPMGSDISKAKEKYTQLKFKQKGNDFVLLFVGRLSELKGCKTLLKSMLTIKDNIPNIKLIIVGTGPLEEKLKQFVIKNNLEKYVFFKGFIPHDEVFYYYSIANISLILSKVDKWGYQEGLPVVLLEAMSFGLPIIGTNTAGIKEVIKNRYNGLLIEPSNDQQVIEAVLELYNDQKLREHISKNAKKDSKRYSWTNTIKKYLDIYNKILNKQF